MAMVMGTCSDMDFFNRCGNYNTYFYLGGKVRAMDNICDYCFLEQESCKQCVYVNPCVGCNDYDRDTDSCKSNGGCGRGGSE